MLKIFDSVNGVYTFPNGKTKTASELKNDPQYSILFTKDCVIDISDGILQTYSPIAQIAEKYGISHVTGVDEPSSTLEKIKKAQEDLKKNPKPTVMDIVVKTAQISAMSFTDEQALEVKDIYPEYQVDHAYKQGDFFTHEGELYKVNQAHTSASQWEPGSVGTESLYTHLTLNEDGYPIWKQPTGAHDAYNKGDIVEYNGELYKSLIDGNAYSPDTYPAGWEKYTEPTE